jgi:HEAT repeat protein
MTHEQRVQIISLLNGRNQVDAFEAAKAVWKDPDEQLEQPLMQTLSGGHRPFNRAAAAYALQIVTTPHTVKALERTLMKRGENARVRGGAAEALAHFHRRKSHDVLIKALGDPSKEVRFWCAFALGEMAEKRALPSLKGLVDTDKRIVRGFHSVGKEAADAIANIESEKIEHRRKQGGCVFCTRR